MDSGGKLNILRQSDLGSSCVSPGLECWGLFSGANVAPRFLTTELAVPRWGCVFPAGRTFRMYLSYPVTE